MMLMRRVSRFVVVMSLAAFASHFFSGSAGVAMAQDGYTSEVNDNSGNFFGIKGLSNKDVISGVTVGLVGLALVSTLKKTNEAAGAAAGASGASEGAVTTSNAGKNATKSIYAVTKASANFSTVAKLIDAAGMGETYAQQAPLTVFWPTDQTINTVAAKGDASKLAAFLKSHTVQGRYSVSDLENLPTGKGLPTLAGSTLAVVKQGQAISVGGAAVARQDISAANGYIHPLASNAAR